MTAVPVNWQGWVQGAAAGTGLPASVVAAQINEESGFDPNATSPTGAQGAAQIEPATWASLGIPGSPYQPQAAQQGYIKYMRQLLARFGGNVRNALAAYNAGPGNLAAGYSYADTILSAAGQPLTAAANAPGATKSSSASSGAYGGLGGFLLKAVITLGLVGAGLFLAGYGVNATLGGAPGRAAGAVAGAKA